MHFRLSNLKWSAVTRLSESIQSVCLPKLHSDIPFKERALITMLSDPPADCMHSIRVNAKTCLSLTTNEYVRMTPYKRRKTVEQSAVSVAFSGCNVTHFLKTYPTLRVCVPK